MSALNVTAKNPGHYGDQHRRPGESFTLLGRADFAASWMDAIGWDPKAPAEPKPAKAPKAPAIET